MDKRTVLKCEKINKKMGRKQILKDVSLEILEGDILGFIGPNGSGKTTTIKLIIGLQSIDSGTVTINGYDIKNDFIKAIERVGTIVENPDLYLYLSGLDNLKLVRNLYKGVEQKRIDEVVKLVGLENRIKDKVSKYSLGMRQRLGIAQAILHKPNILILDEPTNGLDPEGIKELRELLKKLAKEENMAILISSHNLAELDNFCHKVAIIKSGEIIETSEIKELKKGNKKESYIFELNKTKTIEKIFNSTEFEVVDDKFVRFTTSKKDVPKVVKLLVDNQFNIYSIQEESETLEDVFLKKTGGNVID